MACAPCAAKAKARKEAMLKKLNLQNPDGAAKFAANMEAKEKATILPEKKQSVSLKPKRVVRWARTTRAVSQLPRYTWRTTKIDSKANKGRFPKTVWNEQYQAFTTNK